MFEVIAFDADDTLWQNERNYRRVQAKFAQLFADHHSPEWVDARLFETESRNMEQYGYGIKAFTLSMIETAIALTDGAVSGAEIQVILELAKGMLAAEVELLAGVAKAVPLLAERCPLMIITKGDLLDQEAKFRRSGLAPYFRHLEVVSHKSRDTYEQILRSHGLSPQRFLMVGNSLRSDILPILELGGSAVYIPHDTTWLHEVADPPPSGHPGYYTLERFDLLPGWLAELTRSRGS